MKTGKSKQKSREVLTTMGNKHPFRKSPLSQTYQPNKGRAQNTRLLLTKSSAQQTGRRGQQSGYRPQFQGHQRGKNVYNDKQDKQHFLEVSPRFQNGESTSSGENTVSNIFSSSGSTCRKAKSILFKLDKTNTRTKYFRHNTGLRDTFSRENLPNKIAKPSSPEPRTVKPCRGGSQGNVFKRDNTESNTVQKSVHKQSLSDIKKGWGQSPGNKFEISEQFHPLLTLQNGGTQFTSKYATGKGFHVQIRPKRRLLLCATKKGKQEICAFPVGRDTLRVPVSRARSSTTDIYKNYKNTHFITKKATDQGNNIFRRHDIDVTNNRVVNQHSHCDISVNTSRFCNQPEKINAESSTKNRISGPGNGLSCNEIITTSEEGGGNCSDVSKCIKQQDNFEGIDPVD